VADFRISAAIAAIDRITAPVRRIAAVVSTRLTGAFAAAGRASSALAGATLSATGALARYGAAAGVVAVGGLIKAMNASAASAAVIDDLSKRAGIGAETFQELAYAAELSGASAGAFEKALGKFTLTMAGVRSGTGALTKSLEKNAPAFLAQLKSTTSQTEALELMLAALGELDDPTERVKLATLAFGKAGAELSTIALDGADGLKAMRQEAHTLGKVMTQEGIDKAAAYDDSVMKLKLTLAGVVQTIGGRLLPVMAEGATRIGEFISQNGELISQNVGRFFSTVSDIMGRIPWADIIAGARQVIDAVTPLVTTIVTALRDNWGAISRTFREVWRVMVAAVVGAVEVIRSAVDALVRYVAPLFDGLKVLLEGFAQFFEGVFALDLTTAMEGIGKVWDGTIAAVTALFGGLRDFVFGAATAIVGFLDKITPEPLRRAWQAFADFFKALWEGLVGVIDAAVDTIMGVVDTLIGVVDAVVGAVRTVGEAVGLLDEETTSSGAWQRVMQGGAAVAGASPGASSAVPSAVPGAVAAGEASVRSLVEVRFAGAPEGMTIQQSKTSGPGEVKTSVGRRVAGAGAAL
jgi:hypothetical protein